MRSHAIQNIINLAHAHDAAHRTRRAGGDAPIPVMEMGHVIRRRPINRIFQNGGKPAIILRTNNDNAITIAKFRGERFQILRCVEVRERAASYTLQDQYKYISRPHV